MKVPNYREGWRQAKIIAVVLFVIAFIVAGDEVWWLGLAGAAFGLYTLKRELDGKK